MLTRRQAPFAFKVLMIHWILQFALRIAFRCVLHRCESQDIHRQELCFFCKKTRCNPIKGNTLKVEKTAQKGAASRRIRSKSIALISQGRETAASKQMDVAASRVSKEYTNVSGFEGFDNDPSAGSPTETLLRLLLPLNDKVWTASRCIAAGEPTASHQSGGLTGSFNR
jgi:hypothetical protein